MWLADFKCARRCVFKFRNFFDKTFSGGSIAPTTSSYLNIAKWVLLVVSSGKPSVTGTHTEHMTAFFPSS